MTASASDLAAYAQRGMRGLFAIAALGIGGFTALAFVSPAYGDLSPPGWVYAIVLAAAVIVSGIVKPPTISEDKMDTHLVRDTVIGVLIGFVIIFCVHVILANGLVSPTATSSDHQLPLVYVIAAVGDVVKYIVVVVLFANFTTLALRVRAAMKGVSVR